MLRSLFNCLNCECEKEDGRVWEDDDGVVERAGSWWLLLSIDEEQLVLLVGALPLPIA